MSCFKLVFYDRNKVSNYFFVVRCNGVVSGCTMPWAGFDTSSA